MKHYPTPNFTSKKPGEVQQDQFHKEIDVAQDTNIFEGGRPYLVEGWFDCDMEMFFMTYYYSTEDIQDWKEADHLKILKQHGLEQLQDEKYKTSGLGISKRNDKSENEMWVVTATLKDG